MDWAVEAVDEAFSLALERWTRVGAMESPAGWTYRTALNALRRRQRRAAVESRLLRRSMAGNGEASRPHDWSPEIWEALRQLPRRERTAMALRYVADLSTEEIALAMQVAPGTVGSTLHAARAHLAALIGDGAEMDHAALDLTEASDG